MICVFINDFLKKIFLASFVLYAVTGMCQSSKNLWHGIERTIRYRPEGNDIAITNGNKRFNRALYGGNTAFRAEAGDLPEFALYMPGMGGNLKFGIIVGNKSKWLIEAKYIKAIYRAGSMLYEIKDPLLYNGVIYINAIALYDSEGLVVQLKGKNIPAGVQLVVAYGGATGKNFSRDGDIGADPESSFYLKPEYCKDNIYSIQQNSFSLLYGFSKPLTEDERYEVQHLPANEKKESNSIVQSRSMAGIFPTGMQIKIADANAQASPASLLQSDNSSEPVVVGKQALKNGDLYFFIGKQADNNSHTYADVKTLFNKAHQERLHIADRIKVHTPDAYINTLGSSLAIAADAIWQSPSYLHGAVAWRMRLDGWRGPYVADVLGWHDRAREHFSSYAHSQLTAPPVTGIVMDTDLHLGRHLEKIGTALFSDGYISRNPDDTTHAHHYDMNLVFIDELLNHFNWTGDTNYVRQMWPVIKRHLAWEKRNFDADGDGLYDAYAAIWASDALQYSGGGVTHSSAYNYRANKTAAELARLIGENPAPYEQEANKILAAINKELWMPDRGWYAEYKDLLGNKLVHPYPGLWTIYHAIDQGISNPFQSYQSLEYVVNYLPHIPVRAKGLNDTTLYTLSTTNWEPYTWSLNNVALAELLHASLAFWQAGRSEEAYKLWKSSLVESMYLGSSPGNFQQLSFYDAVRGELYRDFADPIGMAARSLVEGLFGIKPDALHDTLTIQPGFPAKWNYASLETPDIFIDFKKSDDKETYLIKQSFEKKLNLKLILPVYSENITSITINDISAEYKIFNNAVGKPVLKIDVPAAAQYRIQIIRSGNNIKAENVLHKETNVKRFSIAFTNKKLLDVFDPQKILNHTTISGNKFSATSSGKPGNGLFFIKVKQGIAEWWQPIHLLVLPDLSGFVNTLASPTILEKIDLKNYFNDKVTNIFKHKYLVPRPKSPALQLPTQGIGNWAYPLVMANIDDGGLRKIAGNKNEIVTPDHIFFSTPSDTSLNNIVFTSQWDNFPKQITIPLSGKASNAHFLMAGSTNPMQSRITNGQIIVEYKDGSADTLNLKNPENWWPIEQDYMNDGYAFTTDAPVPMRLYLQTGKFGYKPGKYSTIKGFTNMAIDGGAATVLYMPLNETKELNSLTVKALANDVVIGLMSVTLERN